MEYFLQDKQPKLYISVLGANRERMNERVQTFISALEQHGFCVYMPFDHQGYAIIEREIDESDAVVALADLYWHEASCKAVEITYALEGCSVSHRVQNHRPIPTFIFWNEEPFRIVYLQSHLQNHSHLTYLPWDVQEAVATLCTYFHSIDKTQ